MLTMQQFFILLREPELVQKSCRVTVSSHPETTNEDPKVRELIDPGPEDIKIVKSGEVSLV